jgi:predicted permease
MNWLARVFRRRSLERDLERELDFHLDELSRDLVRSGLSPEEARRRARIELGGVEQVKEDSRDTRGTRWLEDWVYDTRFALRAMRRTPGFTAAAILTLAIGIGATTAVWSIVDALLMRALPITSPAELHAIRRAGNDVDDYVISYPTLVRMQAALPDSVGLGGMGSAARMYASIGDRPEAVLAQPVSGRWFSVLGVEPEIGRLISVGDDRNLGGHPVAVLSEAFWRRRFGGAPSIVGTTFRLNGSPFSVIGVAGAGFSGLTVGSEIDLWIPATMQHEVRYIGNYAAVDSDSDKPWVPQDGIAWLTLITRVDPTKTGYIAGRLDPVFRARQREFLASSDSVSREYGMREHIVVEQLSRGFSPLREQYGVALRTLLAGVGFVLLTACANLAGLLLARSAARTQEIAVRISLGAGRGRLVRQILTESLVLAAIGGALSLVVARWGSMALLTLASTGSRAIPLAVSLDRRMIGFVFAITLLTGILFGFAPALRVARKELYDTFRAGGRVVPGRSSHRVPLGRVLVASQVALCLVLVSSASLFVRTFQNLLQIDVGYDRERVITARLDLRAAGYTQQQVSAVYQRLLDAVRAVPGVRSASLSLIGLATGARRVGAFVVPGRQLPPGRNSAQEDYVTPDFFVTTGIPLLKGRLFTDADRRGAPRVSIISQSAARHFFGTDDVIGARIGYGTPAEFEIVGVTRDARVHSLREEPARLIYHPLAQAEQEYVTSLEARITAQPEAVITGVRNAIAAVDRNLPIREVVTLGDLLERGLSRERLVAKLGSGFGIIALLLVGIGLYGVVGYSVARRTTEMGVRLALGASPAEVRWVVLRDALVTVAAGLVLGVGLWFLLLGLTQRLVYGLSTHDPRMLAIATVLLMSVGFVASLLPALRASRIDPVRAIRAE